MTELHVYAKSPHKYMSDHKDSKWLFTLHLPRLPMNGKKFVLKQYLSWMNFYCGMTLCMPPGSILEVIELADLDKCGCKKSDCEDVRIMCEADKNLVPARIMNGNLITVNYEELVAASV